MACSAPMIASALNTCSALSQAAKAADSGALISCAAGDEARAGNDALKLGRCAEGGTVAPTHRPALTSVLESSGIRAHTAPLTRYVTCQGKADGARRLCACVAK